MSERKARQRRREDAIDTLAEPWPDGELSLLDAITAFRCFPQRWMLGTEAAHNTSP